MTLYLHKHTEFDDAVEVLRDILGMDHFVPSVLSDSSWQQFFDHNSNEITSTNVFANLKWSKQKDLLLACFANPAEVVDLLPTKNVDKLAYVRLYNLFRAAVGSGFLPTVVLESGPSPKINWIPEHSFTIECVTPSPPAIGVTTATPSSTTIPVTPTTPTSTHPTPTKAEIPLEIWYGVAMECDYPTMISMSRTCRLLKSTLKKTVCAVFVSSPSSPNSGP
jgi:hypothetical protein